MKRERERDREREREGRTKDLEGYTHTGKSANLQRKEVRHTQHFMTAGHIILLPCITVLVWGNK